MSDQPMTPVESDGGEQLRPVFTWGGGTHVGGVRDHNEDAFYVSPEVCVVADGMGGHEAGEVASQLVTSVVADLFSSRRFDVAELPRFVSSLNAAVLRRGAENNTPGMGTTVIGVAIADNGDTPSAVIFHVGDSRCYRLHGGVMTQLTTDHSHVQELVQIGRITAEEALTHPLRNVITRALGADAAVVADFHVLDEENCRLLLCSDGLSGEIDDDRIWDLLTSNEDPTAAAVALIDAVLEGPARDNVTAIVVDVEFPQRVDGRATAIHDITDVPADVTAEIEVTTAAEITAERPVAATAQARAWSDPDPATESTAVVASRSGADPTNEVMVVRPWAPPAVDDRRGEQIDRPSTPSDGAPWESPEANSTRSTSHQEIGNASQHEH
ncbi:MAG: PP2C family serine/threonine-protein phosphatase [Ilumatobacter sp.]